MSLRFLLDTNVVSEPLRPQPNPGVLERLRDHQAQFALAAVVWHELVYGWRRLPASARRDAIARYFFDLVRTTVPILPYNDRAAQWHAQERARLTALGRTPSFADGQIAATAAVHDLTLVTANTDDFADFAELHVVNWFTAG